MNHLLSRVHKRDGRREDFSPTKIAGSILRAASDAGQGDQLLAEELAAVSTMVLERDHPTGEPSTEDVRDVVERVLMETGHLEVVRHFIVYGQRRIDMRIVPGSERSARDARVPPQISSSRHESRDGFQRGRLAADLVLECGLSAVESEKVADGVESKLLSLKIHSFPGSLIDDLVDLELAESGQERALAMRQRFGLSRRRLDSWVSQRSVGGVETEVGEEILRRYSLGSLLDRAQADAHLSGDLELDGLSAPRKALAGSVHCGSLRKVDRARGVAALVRLAVGLRESVSGPIYLAHVERGLALLQGVAAEPRAAVRELLFGLSAGAAAPSSSLADRAILALGTTLPRSQLTALFHRGHDPQEVQRLSTELVRCLISESLALSAYLRVPRLRILLGSPEPRDASGDSSNPGLAPRVDLGSDARRAIQLGLVEFALSEEDVRPLRLVGARIGVNVARVALRCGRRRRSEFLAGLRGAVRQAVAAAARRLRFLQELDDAAVGPLFRLHDLVRELSRELAFELPGRHGYHCAVIPIGLDAAVRAVTERDPAESDEAARLREEAVAWMSEDLPADSGTGTRFHLSEEPFERAERRLGRLDFAAYPRGRDILRLSHDGEAFRYGQPDSALAPSRVLDPGLDPLWSPDEWEVERLLDPGQGRGGQQRGEPERGDPERRRSATR